MSEIVTSILVLSGVFLILTGGIGVLRLPDLLCRSHAVTKALTLGIFLMLLGLWLHLAEEGRGLKIVLAIVFQMLTIPITGHLVSRLALQKNLPRWRHRPIDDHRAARGKKS
jgi:multicomponent Na+:H+ antiporter subunit G